MPLPARPLVWRSQLYDNLLLSRLFTDFELFIMRVSLAAALLVFASTGVAADWPRFRGPNGTGTVDDPGVLSEWGLNDVLFEVAIPGRGNSSPVISKGKLFLQSAGEDGRGRMLLCYDAHDLKHLWTAKVPGGTGRTHAKNSLASSTPAADGQRICALFWDGDSISLHAFDYDGKELWNVPLGSFSSQHGVGQSPVIFEGKVYLNNDQDGSAQFMAFDAATGKKLWSAQRPAFRSCYSSPFLMPNAGGGMDIVVTSTAGFAGHDPDTGKLRWQWDWTFENKPLRTVGSAIAGMGSIFAIAGDGDGSRHMVAVRMPGEKSAEPQLAWEKKQGTAYVPCPLVRGEYVYWASDTGFAVCCEAKTGQIIYNERIASGITSSPILVNGKILCVDERGNAFVYPAEPKFEQPRKVSLGEAVFATPAVADGRLYIRGQRNLFVVGRREVR
jgi:outer membrane protein assembly factor BamB